MAAKIYLKYPIFSNNKFFKSGTEVLPASDKELEEIGKPHASLAIYLPRTNIVTVLNQKELEVQNV